MNLPAIFNSVNTALKEIQINELLETNTESVEYGLKLSEKDASEIIEARNETLQSYGRIDLGIDTTKELIKNFCTSSFINQPEYTPTLIDLQEIFYYMKNETEDSISDEKLIDKMKDFFNNSCQGSLELLQGREIESYAKNIRRKNQIRDYLSGEDGVDGVQ